jgi:P-type Ca2+ transporter type 2C
MVTGDDVITGAAIAKQLAIEGEATLGAEFQSWSGDTRERKLPRPFQVGARGQRRRSARRAFSIP